jgi:hypothetical protein
MHKLINKLATRLPLDFRILYRQFLLRVVDLEALSIQADVVGYLGQFAGVLIMLSLLHAMVTYIGYMTFSAPAARLAFCWHMEHYLISTTMLVIGLITVISWDAAFPDRRDVMVLSPLPIAPHTILFAKIAAAAAVLGLAIVTLNAASGIVLSLLLGIQPGPAWGFVQSFAAYWFTILAASAFLYGSVLTLQGFTALVLPRRIFLRLSAFLQLAAFGLFLGIYFAQPLLTDPISMADPRNQWILASSPSYWFFALFNQLNGSWPAEFSWLASRAWIALGLAVTGAASSLLLCYIHTMKKTVEEPDLMPGAGGLHCMPSFGSSLQTAVALFSIRSLTRSRQHRVAFAFYLAFVFGLALSLLRGELATPAPVSMDLLVTTLLMMFFAVAGLRNVFALPISLTANWVLRTTQLRPSESYIDATRRSLLLLAVVPVWLLSFALSLRYRPIQHVAVHLAVLALLGCVLAELCLIGFHKVPFTCSYLPGKANIQLIFWGFIIVMIAFVFPAAEFERSALTVPLKAALMLSALGALFWALWMFNRHRAKSAVIYFEEIPDQVITTLGLSA